MTSGVIGSWDQARVLALAPDASSQQSARSLASPRFWLLAGFAEPGSLWGECRGSGATPYRTVVDVGGPGYKCSCPSRKIPCKHALGLMLLWAAGGVGLGTPPDWAATWLAGRAARAARAAATGAAATGAAATGAAAADGGLTQPADPAAAERRAEQRAARVASGLDELDQWLKDQVRQGLAATPKTSYLHWDMIAARMVDAQAPGLAERLRSLAAVPHTGAGWESRLLEEYAMLRLLATAHRRRDELPPALTDTVRSRIGFTVRQADVLAGGERVADRWEVLARRDSEQERIRTRRTWLRGRATDRFALILSFAAVGESFDASLRVGTANDLELAFYPGALPLRAIVVSAVETRQDNMRQAPPPDGGDAGALLASWAEAIGRDPWLESWPAVLAEVTPVRSPVPALAGADGAALPLHPSGADCWPLYAVSAGAPLTVAGEWTPRGLWPLTAWDEAGRPVRL